MNTTSETLTKACVLGMDVRRYISYADQAYTPYEKDYARKTKAYLRMTKTRIEELSKTVDGLLEEIEKEEQK